MGCDLVIEEGNECVEKALVLAKDLILTPMLKEHRHCNSYAPH